MGSRGAYDLRPGNQMWTVGGGARTLGGSGSGGVSTGCLVSSRDSERERSLETNGTTTKGSQIET